MARGDAHLRHPVDEERDLPELAQVIHVGDEHQVPGVLVAGCVDAVDRQRVHRVVGMAGLSAWWRKLSTDADNLREHAGLVREGPMVARPLAGERGTEACRVVDYRRSGGADRLVMRRPGTAGVDVADRSLSVTWFVSAGLAASRVTSNSAGSIVEPR